MTLHYMCDISLVVLGPFLTAATGPDRYGVDKSPHRDHQGRIVIPASHCKGKVRAALKEIVPFMEPAAQPDLNALFGAPSAEGSYEPQHGRLRFTDLVGPPAAPPPPTDDADCREPTRARVTINRVSGTARENLLREVEEPFLSGQAVTFTGKISFAAADQAAADALAGILRLGLAWLPTVGSEKGVGFGRVQAVQVGAPHPVSLPTTTAGAALPTGNSLHLRIAPEEPLLIGGIKSRRTNYVASRLELSGGINKGALSMALNEAFGIMPLTRPLTEANQRDYPGFEALAAYFSVIRVTHALPALAGAPRPIRLPLSTVEYDDGGGAWVIGDVALIDGTPMAPSGRASVAYLGDAKHLKSPYLSLAQPLALFVTRSAIDQVSQRTAERQLFTYQFYAPEDADGHVLEWVCNVDFGGIADPAAEALVRSQFATAVETYLRRLGKLGRQVKVTVGGGRAPAALAARPWQPGEPVLVTLQTDAILLDPQDVARLSPGEDLHALYAGCWDLLAGGCLRLVDFFAKQTFEGGYLYHRRLGAAKSSAYRPYYLTGASSVFRFEAVDAAAAANVLRRWQSCGLPLPPWAEAAYSVDDRPTWQNCPFVPGNGYGEIAVNLACHWNSAIQPPNSMLGRGES